MRFWRNNSASSCLDSASHQGPAVDFLVFVLYQTERTHALCISYVGSRCESNKTPTSREASLELRFITGGYPQQLRLYQRPLDHRATSSKFRIPLMICTTRRPPNCRLKKKPLNAPSIRYHTCCKRLRITVPEGFPLAQDRLE